MCVQGGPSGNTQRAGFQGKVGPICADLAESSAVILEEKS